MANRRSVYTVYSTEEGKSTMILTRCFGGLRMHDVVTPPAEQARVRALAASDKDTPATAADREAQDEGGQIAA